VISDKQNQFFADNKQLLLKKGNGFPERNKLIFNKEKQYCAEKKKVILKNHNLDYVERN
jgi:hypothetical protein